ncbi:external invertase, beta-fructofuranosidase Inv1 [Schizosaccharomyces pombe]|uniref:Invertase n=1 Tax=Schizosaccharomyces pombe (strain 972 / ATCC 24843) TaxID=284812 RepID=INV1_SCHPO|nr:beta-fructofuranosidase [Schizosaccharomyces pombe]O59852.1 RecName: Full=Invertase; AltName: Full=Beta-fructofuranosidase; AltName: Full=Saccharase; Flags: Precursor [Schizosaccharomyces pombe 972h-]BAA25684.1 Invertase [Schizosaccharomyces pombe]CAB41057.1 beta-fructofuranosidase [Schizosaccharomyces pombe]|eukprot:NP_588300.1 beta-fructofuranosidase [Schizosaccharomyces pombe]
MFLKYILASGICLVSLLSSTNAAPRHLYVKRYPVIYNASNITEVSNSTTVPPPPFVNTTAPNGTCLGNYNEYLPSGYYNATDRPKIHFTPSSGFMNDPNGLVYTGGVYHMFFQYSPKTLTAGEVHWGHTVSKDLIHWENYPIAIYPDEHENGVLSLPFSGSAVVDVHNSSGLFSNDTIPEERIVLIYTDHWTGVAERQAIAYTTDGGYTFKKYSGNPVLDINSLQFRDPKVIWDFDANRWVMIVAMSQNYGIAFYSSYDLIHWTELSVFSTSGYLGLQYECPGMARVPVEGTDEYKWVLFISINPGAPLGGSVVQYFVGDWNGTNFVPDDGQTRFVDLGKDFYASALYHSSSANADVIGVGWASNWQYTNQAPTQVFRSAMTVARKFTLRDVPQNPMTNLTSLIQTPLNVSLLRDETLFTAPVINSSSSLSGSPITLPSNTAFEFNVTLSINYTEGCTTGYCLGRIIIDSDDPYRLQSISVDVDFAASTLVINRAKAQMGWFNSLFTPSFANDIYIYGNVTLYGIVDNGLLELYVNNGEKTYTNDFFFLQGATPGQISFAAFQGVSFNNVTVTPLKTIWNC